MEKKTKTKTKKLQHPTKFVILMRLYLELYIKHMIELTYKLIQRTYFSSNSHAYA